MKSRLVKILLIIFSFSPTFAQEGTRESSSQISHVGLSSEPSINSSQEVVRITGVRFAYPLVEKWIEGFNRQYPDIQVIIESRGSSDPSQYDVLVEAYEQADEIKNDREYVYIARYAILPVANSKSEFAETYAEKGLDKALLTQVFFHNIYADKEEQKVIKVPFTVYTRLQKAGAPIVFSKYFGFEQKDIEGKSIAGADEHLLKALLRDSTGVSYLPLSLIYDRDTKKAREGIKVIPVDFNGNGRVNDEEKFYDSFPTVTQRLEDASSKDINNIPVEYLHLSVDKKGASPEAITFLRWVINNGEADLHDFGYLKPEPRKLEKDKFEQFASTRTR